MIKSAQDSPAPSFCGKARAPTNHGRHKNFRPRIFAQLSRDLPIFSNFGSNFRRKQNPFHPSFYCIAALPRVPTARTRTHRFAPTPACTTSQAVVGATVNAIAHHPHNRTSNSPATVRIAASTSDICFAPRSAHSHYPTPVPFRAQHSAVTAQTPHHSALNPTPSPYKPSPFNTISYASPFRTEKLPPIRHAPFVTTQSESFGSVFRTGGNIISVFILRLVVPPFRPPNERRTISVLATNGGAAMLKHYSYIMSACKQPLKNTAPTEHKESASTRTKHTSPLRSMRGIKEPPEQTGVYSAYTTVCEGGSDKVIREIAWFG